MKFKRKRILKLKKEFFPVENNYRDSKSICTNEIVKEANRLAAQYNVTILEISSSSWMIGGINIYTKSFIILFCCFCVYVNPTYHPRGRRNF